MTLGHIVASTKLGLFGARKHLNPEEFLNRHGVEVVAFLPSDFLFSSAGDESAPGEYSYHYSVPETESQAWEERTGYTTQGSYSVLLPDGRTMTVTYSVPDSETGREQYFAKSSISRSQIQS